MSEIVDIDYTNHAGERAIRRIEPRRMEYIKTKWHELQWVIIAWDLNKNQLRYFAMQDIHSWKPVQS